jgi:hypothetical protein
MPRLSLIIGAILLFAHSARADFISQVLAANPQGFWTLTDAGPTAFDSSPHNFNGTYAGVGVTPQGIAGPAWALGSVANFSGGNISFPTPLNLGANGYTIEAWINPSNLVGFQRFVASGTAGAQGYGFGIHNTDLIFTTFGQTDYETPAVAIQADQWQYVGVVFDSANIAHFYLNGTLVDSIGPGNPTTPPITDFSLGTMPDLSEPFSGGLAGVSVYNTELSAAQIDAQFLVGVPEPSSLLLTAAAVLGLGIRRALRRRIAHPSISQ